ncbi:hypothetical protein QYF61_000894 [Mycteria americana]|uniref:Uncharacterized protein n=1 Tax=Mycteria americana TaxID=33587 RepID=A0AAN7NNU3_MYCAM|nr:hypothetical protein QYF61_000894 [Mycteria americana]
MTRAYHSGLQIPKFVSCVLLASPVHQVCTPMYIGVWLRLYTNKKTEYCLEGMRISNTPLQTLEKQSCGTESRKRDKEGKCIKVNMSDAEQHQLSQSVLVGEVLQPSDHFCGPPLDPLQQLHVLLVLKTPELDAVLQVGSHQSRVEGQNHLPRPAGHAAFDAAQDMVGLLGCERTLSAHVQLFVHLCPQVLFRRAALDHIIPQPVLKPRIAPTQPCLALYKSLLA